MKTRRNFAMKQVAYICMHRYLWFVNFDLSIYLLPNYPLCLLHLTNKKPENRHDVNIYQIKRNCQNP